MTDPKPLTDLTDKERDNLRNALTIWLRGEPWILVCDLRRAVGYVVAERDALSARVTAAERECEQLRACLAEATEMATDYHSACVAERADREKAERERDEALSVGVHSCHDACSRPACVLRRERDEARALLREAPVTRCECGGDCHDDWRARVAAALGREGRDSF